MSDLFFQKTEKPPKRNYFILPRSISALCFKMTMLQHRFFYSFLEKLESVFLEQLRVYQERGEYILPSQTEAIKAIKDAEGFVKQKVFLGKFVSPSKYYHARKALSEMNGIRFLQPYICDGSRGMRVITGLFYIRTGKEEGKARTSISILGIHVSDLDRICSLDLGFHRQYKGIIMNANLIYTLRLYALAKALSHDGKKPVALRLEDFQTYMGLFDDGDKFLTDSQYNRYCDLKRGLIDPATNELKGLFAKGFSDIWVEVLRKDLLKGNQLPTEFILMIHKN